MSLRYSDPRQWVNIEKQMIFEAWVPYVSDRPLDFFVPCEIKDSTYEGKRVGFLTEVIEDDSIYSTHLAVSELRRRKVVILSRDDVCQATYEDDVLIAKIITVKDHHRSKPWYEQLVEGTHQWFVHLPAEITGKESYINMSQIMTIGKKMLIQKHKLLPSEQMEMVEARYVYGVELGVIKDLDDEIAVSK